MKIFYSKYQLVFTFILLFPLLLLYYQFSSAQWATIYGSGGDDVALSMEQTNDGGYILAGYGYLPVSSRSLWVLKLYADGTIQWQKAYGGPDWDAAKTVHQTSDGGYIVAGYTRNFGDGGIDLWVLKLYSDGTVQWQKTYGGNGNYANIQPTNDGGYILTGRTATNEAWILKLESDGTIQWQKTYEGLSATVSLVYQTDDDGYVVAGRNLQRI